MFEIKDIRPTFKVEHDENNVAYYAFNVDCYFEFKKQIQGKYLFTFYHIFFENDTDFALFKLLNS